MLYLFAIVLGMVLGWILRAVYAAKVHPPRSVMLPAPRHIVERNIGRSDTHHFWTRDGGIWEASTAEEKASARQRAVSLRNHGVHPPAHPWWHTIL